MFWIGNNLHHFRKSVSFNEAILCFIIRKMVPNCKTPHMCFLRFQETLKLDYQEAIFPKIVLVIILWNVMSQNRFSCWVRDPEAIYQLDCMIFPSAVPLWPLGCLEWKRRLCYWYCMPGPLVIFIVHFILLISEQSTKQEFWLLVILILIRFTWDCIVAKVDPLIQNVNLCQCS